MLKIAWSSIYNHPLPPKHRFPMEKYDLLPQQLLHEGTVTKENFFEPRILTEEEILTVHKEEYWSKLKTLNLTKSEERKSGFPINETLVRRERIINAGTIECALFALKYGISMNIAGGTHHAYSDHAEGFCLLNDQAIASRYLLDHGLANKILILDLDVHQGNGTAEIFQHEPRVFTFSMHGEKNYPMKKEESDLDIPLRDGIKDAEYLLLLEQHLEGVLEQFEPDFIFFQSGVDVLETDKLGRLSLTIDGCRQRDEIVISVAQRERIPLVASMGGGYSEEIKQILEAHANTYRLAQELFF
ncbi:MAG: histone deacetylase [Cyclobacteriaceae bacterium]